MVIDGQVTQEDDRLTACEEDLWMANADEKIIVSSEKLALVLYYWLSLRLAKPEIKRRAREWHVTAWTRESRQRFRCELVALETWIVRDISLAVFGDVEELRPILDSAFSMVYVHLAQVKDVSWDAWASSLGTKWKEYDAAMATEHPQGPLWVLAIKVHSNLFGECRSDVEALLCMMIDIAFGEKHFGEAIRKYELR